MTREEYIEEAGQRFVEYCLGMPHVSFSREQAARATSMMHAGYDEGISPEQLGLNIAYELGILSRTGAN